MLMRRYDDASSSFHAALERSPDNTTILLNLADAEWLRGRPDDARTVYRSVLALLDQDPAAGSLTNQLIRAQCQAHLDRSTDAVRAALNALRQAPENSEALYVTSLVYALIGDRASAIANTSRAVEKGVQRRWYELPWFDGLRADPEFQGALNATGAS